MGRASKENKVMAIFLLSLFFLSSAVTFILIGEQWSIVLGGADWDGASSIELTSDGGYIVAGTTTSYGSGGPDAWLIKIDSTGHLQWNKTYGGAESDSAISVQQTLEGGYIFAGETRSNTTSGSVDAWLVKVDSNGNMQWSRTFGVETYDGASSVCQAADGGYLVAGSTSGYLGPDFVNYAWIMKFDSLGSMQWNKTYADTNSVNVLGSIEQTLDGGYVMAGYKTQFGYDAWVIKIDSEGNTEWSKTYGAKEATELECAFCVQQTSDGRYIVAGGTTVNSTGESDFWLFKIDSGGNIQWSRTYGGPGYEEASCVRQTVDQGYIVVGFTYSYPPSNSNAWLVRTDASGNPQSNQSCGGLEDDYARSIALAPDGGYVFAGLTYSFGGWGQAWVAKVYQKSSDLT